MGAVDHGYRVILVRDGVCSSSDQGHDALLELYHRRFSTQIETADVEVAEVALPVGAVAQLAKVQESGGSCGQAGGERVLESLTIAGGGR
jgi:hypothetical protein